MWVIVFYTIGSKKNLFSWKSRRNWVGKIEFFDLGFGKFGVVYTDKEECINGECILYYICFVLVD